MKPLDKALRNKLERTIQKARAIAEAAAKSALEQLGVEQAAPYSYLSEEERVLRRRLRAHGRQLGDVRDSDKQTQEIERLIEEVAYEHWHRMLFARFLAENDLLMYFEADDNADGVPVTLAECDELAPELGCRGGWDVAAKMAARMLPQIFRPDSPVFGLMLPPEREQELEKLVAELPQEVFTASDSLGWVYQFWQAKKKEEVNDSGVKIGARELPAVTQLFTEPYMVSFLLDNSLGAWWAVRRLIEDDWQNAVTEDELRQKASLPDIPLEYLRFVRDEAGRWTPAGGTFDEWPDKLSELKVLDPCCGSGHFLVAAFLMLVPMRMKLEGFNAREACDAVLRNNLHGLELDQRCVELAAFALALTAWRYSGTGGYRVLPALQIACSGLAINASEKEWLALADGNDTLKYALEALYEQFKNAPMLGSLMNPEAGLYKDTLFTMRWEEVAPLLYKAIKGEEDMEKTEMSVAAYGMTGAASLLTGKYHWVITNVPYLARGKQGDILRKFCEIHYPDAKNDLATVFLDRCLSLSESDSGTVSVVLPQNWLFLTTYKKFREKLLHNEKWNMIVRLGAQAFQTPMWDFNVQLLTISNGKANATNHQIAGIDASEPRNSVEKAALLRIGEVKQVAQERQLNNPDARVTLDISIQQTTLLSAIADYGKGSTTGDAPRFLLFFWEKANICCSDTYWLNSPESGKMWSGRRQICNTSLESLDLTSQLGCWLRGQAVWGYPGVAVNKMQDLKPFLYAGEVFDDNICPICPHNKELIPAIYSYVESGEYREQVRAVDQALKVTAATLVKVPFDLKYWQQVATEKYPNGLPKPYSDDPSQWIFHGHPAQSEHPLQVAVARLLGYRWPAELDQDMELSEEARERKAKCEELLQSTDQDGIVCIPSVRGEAPAADRLLNLLAKAYEGHDVNEQVSALLVNADYAGRSLESWLRDKFFTQHCKLFHHRPFIWHIWDGLPDGFAALVNYHKLDRKNLETLIYTYLGDWIKKQKDEMSSHIDGAVDRLAAAESLKKSLELVLQGEEPYDIFVRWKPLEKQPIGWEPDLNDGVRLNIRPFLTVPAVGKKGAGVLRAKPNIDWKKDRGKDVPSAPWYQLGPEYGGNPGDRINDHHLSLAEKMRSGAAHRKESV